MGALAVTSNDLKSMDYSWLGRPLVVGTVNRDNALYSMDFAWLGRPMVVQLPPPPASTEEERPGMSTKGARLSDDGHNRRAAATISDVASGTYRTTTVITRTAADRTGLL